MPVILSALLLVFMLIQQTIMKHHLLIFLFALLSFQSFGQAENRKNTYLKVSAGRVAFGSGDFLGYSIAFDVSKNVIKKSNWGLARLLIGGEFIFENGVKNPVIKNPTLSEFFSKSFQHVSSTIIWTKASYYPFKKIVKGFNIQVGPTFGYSYRSAESQARRAVDALGNSVRQSILAFDNGFIVGYRISTGIEFDITKKVQAGFRLDFSNNDQAEINTLVGLKVGLKL
jgi:hypothetical protein